MLQRTTSCCLVTPQQTLAAARKAGLDEEQLQLSGLAVLTFSRAVVERLDVLCALQDGAWISPSHHPYAAPHVFKRGMFQGIEVVALVPPMGASPWRAFWRTWRSVARVPSFWPAPPGHWARRFALAT